MQTIMKTFILSRISLVYLFYLILIVSTVSNQTVEQPIDSTLIQTDENINNAAEGTSPIPPNVKKGEQNEIFSNFVKRFSRNSIPQTNENGNNTNDSKENVIRKPDDQNPDDETDPLKAITLGISSESTNNGDLEPNEEKIETANYQNIKEKETNKPKKKKKKKKKKNKNKKKTSKIVEQNVNDYDLEAGTELKSIEESSATVDSTITQITSNADKNATEYTQDLPQNQKLGTEGNPEDNSRKVLGEIIKRMNSGNNNNQINGNENENKNIESDDEKKIGQETGDTVESEIVQTSEPEKNSFENTQDAAQPLQPINSNELTLSPLDKVEIVKIKGEQEDSERKRKKKKKATYKAFNPSEGNARIYCTFLGDVLKMYKKVQNHFDGHFCHAIVYGTPIILVDHRVHLGGRTRDQLRKIHKHKNASLNIVIMQYKSYADWKQALLNHKGLNTLVEDIIRTVKRHGIDGIQFSNLHPEEGYQIDNDMMGNLIRFFKLLKNEAKKKNVRHLKIGITIDMHGLSNTKSFTSFNNLNPLVTWYSFKSISMVKCSLDYQSIGTSPLHGTKGFNNTIETLIQHINHDNKFDMSKLVVGIQLFPNKIDDSKLYTYEEYCSEPKNTWDSWCAAQPEELRLKGEFLRTTQIGGFQLYYMHSDDYRSTCGCYTFPLIRALLRGLINIKEKEECDFRTAHN